MWFTRIGYEHRQEVERLREQFGHDTSSHSFAALNLWQEEMKLSIALEEDCFYVKCGWLGRHAYFFPCGTKQKICSFVDRHKAEEDFRLVYLRKQDTGFLRKHFPAEFCCRYAEDAAEYVYSKEEQMKLQGKAFARIRTRIHHFYRSYNPVVRRLDDETIGDALAVAAGWAARNDGQPNGICDIAVTDRMITEQKALGIDGIVVYLAGEPTAVMGGYALTNRIYDLCLAKMSERIPGLDYYARKQLYERLPERFEWINTEEDLGIYGLRMHKKNLRPAYMAGMWEGERL